MLKYKQLQTATKKLPGHPQNPNFSYEVTLGLTNAKSCDRWIILN